MSVGRHKYWCKCLSYLGNDLGVKIHRQAILPVLIDGGVDTGVHRVDKAFRLASMPISTDRRIALPFEEPRLGADTHRKVESNPFAS